jgi:predicted transcriptional regulator
MTRERGKVLLTRLELEVMRAVWDAPPESERTVRDVVERLNSGRRPPLAYNTVQTVLGILREKGVVRVRPGEGRAHVFVPRVSRAQVTTSMVGELVERLLDGRVEPLLLNLVEREELAREELERLRTLLDERLVDRGFDSAGDGNSGDERGPEGEAGAPGDAR